jgi:hypothetical protein
MNNSELAHVLYKLQETKNNGHGLLCIRQIVAFLKRDQRLSAEVVAEENMDLIHNYPDIEAVILINLLEEKTI